MISRRSVGGRSPEARPQRLRASVALLAGTAVLFATSAATALNGVSTGSPVIAAKRGSLSADCHPGGQRTAGEYAGSFSIRFEITTELHDQAATVSGPLEAVTVDTGGRVTNAKGSFMFTLDGTDRFGMSAIGSTGSGTFRFKEGDNSTFEVVGSGEAAVTVSGDGGSYSGTGGGTSRLRFQVAKESCTELRGVVEGPFIDDLKANVQRAGARVTVTEATWNARRSDPGGQDLLEAMEGVQTEAQDIAQRALNRTIDSLHAVKEFEALGDSILASEHADDPNARACLWKILKDAYLGVAPMWQHDDFQELDRLSHEGTSEAHLERVRVLISQILHRDREFQLMCGGESSWLETIGEPIHRIASRMARAQLFTKESVNQALEWGKKAQMFGSGDDGGTMDAARRWAHARVKEYWKRLDQALQNTNPTDAERRAILALAAEAQEAERQADLFGVISEPEVPKKMATWCGKVQGGC